MTARPAARIARAHLALAALIIASLGAAAGPRDPLYRWSDADGNVRYTSERERIPLLHRADAERVELPPEPEAPLPALGGPPSPESAADDEALPAVDAAGASDAAASLPDPPSPLDARIAALEQAIEADEAILTAHISDPDRAASLGSSEEIAAIAERLPRLQAELRALREQRAASAVDGP